MTKREETEEEKVHGQIQKATEKRKLLFYTPASLVILITLYDSLHAVTNHGQQ